MFNPASDDANIVSSYLIEIYIIYVTIVSLSRLRQLPKKDLNLPGSLFLLYVVLRNNIIIITY